MDFSGVFTALVTPFKKGELDEQSFRQLVRSQLAGGVSGLVVNGTTGESPTLQWDEVKRLFDWAREEVGSSVPLILGTGSNSTQKTIELTQEAGRWGADGALVVTPYYNKPPQRGLVQHFENVANQSEVPVLLYNVPARTIASLSLETILTLSRHPNIVGIKEATGDVNFGVEIMESTADDFLMTSGDDATCLDLIKKGGDGVISVMSNVIPQWLSQAYTNLKGGREEVGAGWEQVQKLIDGLYVEANPIGIKMALYLKGVIRSPELRLPLVQLGAENTEKLKAVIDGLDL